MVIKEGFYAGGTYGPTLLLEEAGDLIYRNGQIVNASINHIQEDIDNIGTPIYPDHIWYLAIWTEEEGTFKTVPLETRVPNTDGHNEGILLAEAAQILETLEI
jgi:hypothetical protein